MNPIFFYFAGVLLSGIGVGMTVVGVQFILKAGGFL